MDFGVLSKYDDLLATYFLDSFYLWFSTVRMNMDFIGPQIDTAPIVAIIRDQIVKQRDPSKAALEFLKMPFFQDYLQDKTEKRKLEFTQHLKRYMYMFMPNAGFEISSTDRYTGQLEACIVATRDWEAGEQVTCCQGAIAELNKEEDAKLKKEGRDFSVMVSTRKKCTCLFLGPARFMNHDCDANCEFIQLNQNAITFRIKRNITEGEEMTVFYGEHYFGEDNCECLCASCEKRHEGSFSLETDNTPPAQVCTSGNSHNSGTSPTPSLSSSSSSRDKGSNSNKNGSNPRRSCRKRKDISYTDYFEPVEPKKARRGKSEKEPEHILQEQLTSKRVMVLEQKDIDLRSSNNGSVDMENIDPSQTSLCMQKKLEPSRQQEMNLSFICESMESYNDNCDQWVYIPSYPDYDPVTFLEKTKDIQAETHFPALRFDVKYVGQNCPPGEAVLVPVPPLVPIRPTINHNTTQEMYEGSFQVDLDLDYTEEMERIKRKRESHGELVGLFNWCDGLSELSEMEEIEEEQAGPCCPQYNEVTAIKGTDMCARCHRHYSIYGIRWPVRKIRKVPGKKRVTKRVLHKQQPPNPIVSTPNITTTPSLSLPPSTPPPPPPPPRRILAKPASSTSFPLPPPLPPSAPIAIPSSNLRSPPPPSLPPPQLHSPTSPSPLLQQQQQQKLFSDTMDTTIDKLRMSSLSSSIGSIQPMLDHYLNEATESLSEELENQDMSLCSRPFNSLVPVDLFRE